MKRFWEYIQNREQSIIASLSSMTPIQQAELDISLHNDASAKNSFGQKQSNQLIFDTQWKKKVIDIFQGIEKDPEIIKQTINIIVKDINSHRNRQPDQKTGSYDWHNAWISVYKKWINILQKRLGEHGT